MPFAIVAVVAKVGAASLRSMTRTSLIGDATTPHPPGVTGSVGVVGLPSSGAAGEGVSAPVVSSVPASLVGALFDAGARCDGVTESLATQTVSPDHAPC